MPYIFPKSPETSRALRVFCRFAPVFVFTIAGGFSIGGCGREVQGGSQSSGGPLSIPPDGFVRIISRQIVDAPLKAVPFGMNRSVVPESVHYHWSLIGERNWQNPKADKTGFALGDVYPLNATTRRGGCNTWECDLTAQTVPDAPQSKPTTIVRWRLVIHGSNGQTADAVGQVSQQTTGPLKDSIRVVQTRDEAVRLPANMVLATITDSSQKVQEIILRVAEK